MFNNNLDKIARYVFKFSALIILIINSANGTNVLIRDIKNTYEQCDYLIITPEIFQENAIRLADHRNNYVDDHIENAHVILLGDIYKDFTTSDTLLKHEIVWYSLRWIYQNWAGPLKYLVLFGDDSLVFNEADTMFYSYGRMPTYIEPNYDTIRSINTKGITCRLSDDWYTAVQCENPPYHNDSLYIMSIVAGRIPCETNYQCSTYINKVINFDLHSPKGIWRNNAVVIADDEFAGPGVIDNVWFEMGSDNLAEEFNDFFVSKCYLAFLPKDSDGGHLKAREFFFDKINSGTLWSIYWGHGHYYSLTHERFINANDYTSFNNDSMPTIFMSLGCNNGRFYLPEDSSMCKRFLFTPKGGCIIYVASTRAVSSTECPDFGERILSKYISNPRLSIGKIVLSTKMEDFNEQINKFSIHGDPSLITTKDLQILKFTLKPDENNPTSILCSVDSQNTFKGNYYCTFSFIDTVKTTIDSSIRWYVKDSTFSVTSDTFFQSFEISIPPEVKDKKARFIAYIWNETSEARKSVILNSGNIGIITSNNLKHLKDFFIRLNGQKLIIKSLKDRLNDYTEISLFNIRGQKLYKKEFTKGCNYHYIDLKQIGIAEGNYIVIVNNDKGSYRSFFQYFY